MIVVLPQGRRIELGTRRPRVSAATGPVVPR